MINEVLKKSRRDANRKKVLSKYFYLRLKLDGMLREKWYSLKTDNKEIAREKARKIKIDKEKELNGLDLIGIENPKLWCRPNYVDNGELWNG